ncbi:hypothetical protein LTR53_000129 [Teratosphaeriaceae sp. CCFEE 6253]|nr:hypothetical protein LTR53_000129 [Teratosphaeriaceae sp. CCFEE 6253]
MPEPEEPNVAIENALPSDAPSTVAIYNHYVNNSIVTLQETDASLAEMQQKMAGISSQDLPFLVIRIRDSDILCGYAYAGPWSERTGYRYTAECSVYLHPDYCGKGLGRQLLEALLIALRKRGTKQVVAKISVPPHQDTAEVRSCRLHMSLGFQVVGRLQQVGFKQGGWIDVAFLQCSLETDTA